MFLISSDRKSFILFLTLLSFFFACFFAFISDYPLLKDSAQYDLIGWNLAQGNGFSISDSYPFEPTMFREPGYPFFLSAIYVIFGHEYFYVRLFQVFIYVLICLLIYFIALEISGEKIARYSSFFAALCPTLANYTRYVLSEGLFTFLLCLSTLLFMRFVKQKKPVWIILCGFILGIAALIKVAILFFVFPMLIFLAVLSEGSRDLMKKHLKCYIIFIVFFLLPILPWMARNKAVFGTYNFTLRQGVCLAGRADRLDDSFDSMKKHFVYNFSEHIAKKLFPETVVEGENFAMQGSKKANLRFMELVKSGIGEVEADRIMKQEALSKIKKKPFKYLVQSVLEFEKLAAFFTIPLLTEPKIVEFADSVNAGFAIFTIKGFFKILSYFVIIFMIIGFYVERNKWRIWLFPCGIVCYFNLLYSLLFGVPRYVVSLVPFYIIFATIGISGVLRLSGDMKK